MGADLRQQQFGAAVGGQHVGDQDAQGLAARLGCLLHFPPPQPRVGQYPPGLVTQAQDAEGQRYPTARLAQVQQQEAGEQQQGQQGGQLQPRKVPDPHPPGFVAAQWQQREERQYAGDQAEGQPYHWGLSRIQGLP